MPAAIIVRKNQLQRSFRVDSIIDRHELKPESANIEIDVNIPIEGKNWSIGVIVGSSGSGKTTIVRELFSQDCEQDLCYGTAAIIDEMPKNKSLDEIARAFNSVGFGTIWHWLKPYHVLSQGEQMRVDLARAILSDKKLICFDEFTSVVDRDIAKIASFSIAKAIRKTSKQFIAVTCHRDILEWLEPDWVYDTDRKEFFFAQANTIDRNYTSTLDRLIANAGNILESFTI